MNVNRKQLAFYWIDKSKKSFRAAENEFCSNNLDFCVNRLYYSVFYAMNAVLILREQSYKKHSAVRSALHRDFVKKGIIPIKYGKLYDALLRDREEADYLAFVQFDSKVIEEEIEQTRELLGIFSEILNSELKED